VEYRRRWVVGLRSRMLPSLAWQSRGRRSKARVLAVTGVAGCRLDDLLLGALDPPFSSGRERGLDSIANVEFAKDLLYVRLDRVLAEVNPVGDFTVREPSGNEPDDLQLGVYSGDR